MESLTIPPAPAAGSAGSLYTCPMHPEIRQAGPGNCPICGMVLEPLMPTDTDDDTEVRVVRRRFWICAALSLPVVVVAMLPHLLHQASLGTPRLLRAVSAAMVSASPERSSHNCAKE
jgi:hypothetical protein